MYYANPIDDNVAPMLDRIYYCKFEQYMNALIHIVNTGQGVVLENSVYTDFVFLNAMRSKDHISLPCKLNFFYKKN